MKLIGNLNYYLQIWAKTYFAIFVLFIFPIFLMDAGISIPPVRMPQDTILNLAVIQAPIWATAVAGLVFIVRNVSAILKFVFCQISTFFSKKNKHREVT